MYASIRRYRVEAKNLDTILERLPGAVEVISKLPGFEAYYAVRGEAGTFATVSVFSDRAAADHSIETASRWAREHLAGLLSGPPEVVVGEVVAHK